jgi:hypothetical protein
LAGSRGVGASEGHRPMTRNARTRLRRWRAVKRRPVRGNSPNDRILRGPDCDRPKRVCADYCPATPSPKPPETGLVPGMRFLRFAESIAPMEPSKQTNLGVGYRLPLVGPQAPVRERDGRCAPCSSSAMSSDRLFLDRVARQQSPSPLHRHPQTNTHFSRTRKKGDISTLPGRGTFLLCLDRRIPAN